MIQICHIHVHVFVCAYKTMFVLYENINHTNRSASGA